MNSNTSPKTTEAIITYSYDKGILAFTKSAEILLSEFLSVKIKRGKSISELFPPDITQRITDHIEKCQYGALQNFQIQVKEQKLNLHISPILNDDLSIDSYTIIFEKTQEIGAKQGLNNSNPRQQDQIYNEEVYSNLFHNNPDAVFSFDLKGNFVNANESSAEMAEISISELLKLHFLQFIQDSDKNKVLEHFQQALLGHNQIYEANFQSVNGTKKVLELTNFPIVNNKEIIGVFGIAKDITPQKIAEKKVLEERKMLRAIIDNIPDYIFVKDREHKSILSNRKFYTQILGKDLDDSDHGYTPLDYMEPEKGKEIMADNEMVMNSGLPVINRPDTVLNIQGEEEKVLLTKVPLLDQKENIIGLVGIARDITETYLQNRRQELIFKIIKAFGDEPTFQDAMIKTLMIFCEYLGYDYAESYRVSVNNQKLVRTAFFPLDQDLSEEKNSYGRGEGFPGTVWESGKVEVITARKHPRLLNGMVLHNNEPLQTAIGIPIIFQDQLISIFCLGSVEEKKNLEIEMLSDITLQIASAIEGKRSQEQLNDFFRYSPNLIAVIGIDGFVKKINPSFKEKLGYSEDQILSKPFVEFIHQDDLNKTYEAIEKVSVEGSDFEIRCKKKDGNYLWISWRFSQFFEKENVVFVYGTDITPLKEIHQELSGHITERKMVQKKLAESEKKYRSLFDVSPLPMWVLERKNLKFLKVNQAAIKLYGYTEEEFLKMTVRDLWAPNQREHIKKVLGDNKDEYFQLKVKHCKKNGEIIFVNVNSNPLVFDGTPARISHVKNDTDRIKAEEKILHSKQRFKALIQEGSDLISIVDSEYNFIYNSPASKAVLGLEPTDLVKTNFRDYIHEEDKVKIEEYISKLKHQKRVQLPSYRVKGAGDACRWIETIITDLRSDPAIEGIVMNSRDITEFMEQERELIESLKRYDIVSKATSDIITDYDIKTDKMRVSAANFEMFGYTNDDGVYTGEWWKEKVHPDDLEIVNTAELRMHESEMKNLTIEYRFRCADGSYKYILDRSYLISDENNDPERIIGSMQDITERKHHLIAIENHNKRLKEIGWTQSHLVRAPLAKIMGLVDLLLSYKNDLENVDEILEKILNSADELDAIIRKIARQSEKEI